ncbi:MAG: hypothetical protein K2V38_25870 [Gemmataceae bacterium]|nr:hypothetical protein [Gemmataceae bacterium]
MLQRSAVVVGLLVVAGWTAAAQEPAPKSRLDTSNVVPSTFRAQLVVDNRFTPKVAPKAGEPPKDADRDPRDRTGKMHCLVCEYGLSPVVAVFVRADPAKLAEADGLSKFLKRLDFATNNPLRPRDGLLARYQADKMGAFVMFLTLDGGQERVTVKGASGADEQVIVDKEYPHDEKRDEKREAVRKYFDAVKTDKVPFGLAADKSAALTAFQVGDAPVTVVIYNRMRIANRWALKSDDLTDAKIAEIVAGVEDMVKTK